MEKKIDRVKNKKIDRVKKFDDFMAFDRKLRLAIYFYEKAKWDQGEEGKGEKREETGAISKKNALGETQ